MGMGHVSGDANLASRGSPDATRKEPLYITILTGDNELVDAVREAATGHTVTAAASVEDAVGLAADGQCAILVTDRDLSRLALDRIVGHLKTYEPALVTIAVGRREDDSALIALLSAGIVDRFMIKPLTPGPARLAIESAAREHYTLKEHLRPGTDSSPTQLRAPSEPRATPRELTLVRSGNTAPFRRSTPAANARAAVVMQPSEPNEADAITNVNVVISTERSRVPRRNPTTALRLAPRRETNVETSADAQQIEVTPTAASLPPRATMHVPRPIWFAVVAALILGGAMWWFMSQRAPSIDPRPIIAANIAAGDRAFTEGHFLDPAERSAAHYYSFVLALDPDNAAATRGLERIATGLIDQTKALIVERRFAEATIALQNVRRVRPEHRELPYLEAQLREQLEVQLAAQTKEAPVPTEAVAPTPEAQKAPQLAVNHDTDVANQRLAQSRLVASADEAIAAGKLDAAGKMIIEAQALGVSRAELARLSKALSATQADTSQREWLALVLERIEQNRLIEPTDSARYYLKRLAEVDRESTNVKRATDALGSRLVANAQVAIFQKNNDLAGRLLSQARDIGFARPDLEAAEAALAATRPASVPTTAATATSGEPGVSEPKLLKYVPPEYPRDARLRGYEGWVDVQLSVTSLGDVVGTQVLGGERVSAFEQAALDAVRKWKYERRTTTDPDFRQTVKTRVRFKLAD
jgi:TonB family protein